MLTACMGLTAEAKQSGSCFVARAAAVCCMCPVTSEGPFQALMCCSTSHLRDFPQYQRKRYECHYVNDKSGHRREMGKVSCKGQQLGLQWDDEVLRTLHVMHDSCH